MFLSPPLTTVRYIQYLTGQEHVPDLGIGLEPSCVNVMYKANSHRYKFIGEEDFLGQYTWPTVFYLGPPERNSRKRKEMHPLKNKTEFHHGCQDPRRLPKKYIPS